MRIARTAIFNRLLVGESGQVSRESEHGVSIIVFEDAAVAQLYPITIGKAACVVRCGGCHLLDVLAPLDEQIHCVVRPHLWEVMRQDYPRLSEPHPADDQTWLFINARAAPAASLRDRLARLLAAGQPGVVHVGDSIAAAVIPPGADRGSLDLGHFPVEDFLRQQALPPMVVDVPLLHYPHDAVRQHMQLIGENLEDRIARGEYRQLQDGLFVGEGVTLGDHLVIDSRSGPIVVDDGATIGPFSYLSGPVYIGPRAKVLEHAALKDAVALGHTTKVGGEVEASVIEPYTNKQHHGFLGHSYLGSWINLGAGTCNSDLKNTYGEVKMEYNGRKVSSGMQFLGCIVGDYSKSAINTSIFTGKTIGCCSMVYGFVTTNVPSFVNYARSFGQVTELPVEVMAATQARMFSRRDVPQRPCDAQLLHAMYALTGRERQLAGEPLSL